MKVAVVLLALLVVAYAAPEKRLFRDTIDKIRHAFTNLWNSTKDEFNRLKNGIHSEFWTLLGNLGL